MAKDKKDESPPKQDDLLPSIDQPGENEGPVIPEGYFLANKKRFYATDEFEGSVGDGGLSTVKYKKGQEIRDEPLALSLVNQGQPIEVKVTQVLLEKTFTDPKDPVNGRWAYRKGAVMIDAETYLPPEQKKS